MPLRREMKPSEVNVKDLEFFDGNMGDIGKVEKLGSVPMGGEARFTGDGLLAE